MTAVARIATTNKLGMWLGLTLSGIPMSSIVMTATGVDVKLAKERLPHMILKAESVDGAVQISAEGEDA